MADNKELVIVYLTCANLEEAQKIGQHLVEKRLVACVNIIPKIFSYYWWEGQLVSDEEVSLIAKTQAFLKERIIEEVKKVHSYEVPAILFLPIADGNPDFLSWIKKEAKI